jgi:rhodanese-related sulfurtransferase
LNIPVPELRTRYKELNPRAPVAVICNTGQRSSLGASILKQHGFQEVYNAAGGMTAFSAAGYAGECPVCIGPHGPQVIAKQ